MHEDGRADTCKGKMKKRFNSPSECCNHKKGQGFALSVVSKLALWIPSLNSIAQQNGKNIVQFEQGILSVCITFFVESIRYFRSKYRSLLDGKSVMPDYFTKLSFCYCGT